MLLSRAFQNCNLLNLRDLTLQISMYFLAPSDTKEGDANFTWEIVTSLTVLDYREMNGMSVPIIVIEQLVRELDPPGNQERKTTPPEEKNLPVQWPKSLWLHNGHYKLKPYGSSIHGYTDGWSRKIMCLYVTCSNNFQSNVAAHYLEAA